MTKRFVVFLAMLCCVASVSCANEPTLLVKADTSFFPPHIVSGAREAELGRFSLSSQEDEQVSEILVRIGIETDCELPTTECLANLFVEDIKSGIVLGPKKQVVGNKVCFLLDKLVMGELVSPRVLIIKADVFIWQTCSISLVIEQVKAVSIRDCETVYVQGLPAYIRAVHIRETPDLFVSVDVETPVGKTLWAKELTIAVFNLNAFFGDVQVEKMVFSLEEEHFCAFDKVIIYEDDRKVDETVVDPRNGAIEFLFRGQKIIVRDGISKTITIKAKLYSWFFGRFILKFNELEVKSLTSCAKFSAQEGLPLQFPAITVFQAGLCISCNAATPSGEIPAMPNIEIGRYDFTTKGADIGIKEIYFCLYAESSNMSVQEAVTNLRIFQAYDLSCALDTVGKVSNQGIVFRPHWTVVEDTFKTLVLKADINPRFLGMIVIELVNVSASEITFNQEREVKIDGLPIAGVLQFGCFRKNDLEVSIHPDSPNGSVKPSQGTVIVRYNVKVNVPLVVKGFRFKIEMDGNLDMFPPSVSLVSKQAGFAGATIFGIPDANLSIEGFELDPDDFDEWIVKVPINQKAHGTITVELQEVEAYRLDNGDLAKININQPSPATVLKVKKHCRKGKRIRGLMEIQCDSWENGFPQIREGEVIFLNPENGYGPFTWSYSDVWSANYGVYVWKKAPGRAVGKSFRIELLDGGWKALALPVFLTIEVRDSRSYEDSASVDILLLLAEGASAPPKSHKSNSLVVKWGAIKGGGKR